MTRVVVARWIDVEERAAGRVDLDAQTAIGDVAAFAREPRLRPGHVRREVIKLRDGHFDRFGDVDAVLASGAHIAQSIGFAREGQAHAELLDVKSLASKLYGARCSLNGEGHGGHVLSCVLASSIRRGHERAVRDGSQALFDVALRQADTCRTGLKKSVGVVPGLRQSAQAHALDATGERRVRRDAQCGLSSGSERVDEGAVGVACHTVDGRVTGEADAHAAGGDLAQHDFDSVETAIDERERLFEVGGDACGLDCGATDDRPAGAENPSRLCVEVSVSQLFAALASEDTDVLLATGERTAPALDFHANGRVVHEVKIVGGAGASQILGGV